MTDDYAIEGEEGGYVPCLELPAQLVVEEEGAISGRATGFVAAEAQAASLPTQERGAIVGSGVGFVPRPCCDVDWIYYVFYEHFAPDGAPDGVINALLGPEDNAAKYTGTVTGSPTDSGRTWLFAEAVIDCPQLVFVNGRLDLYYEVEQGTDHYIFDDLNLGHVDEVKVHQLGHIWLNLGTDPPGPNPTHYIVWYFMDGLGPFAGNLHWRMVVESYGGTFISGTSDALQPGPFEAGTRYSVRVYINRNDPGGFDLKAKLWKTSDTEPVDWMFSLSGSNVQVSDSPVTAIKYAVRVGSAVNHILTSHDVGERHLMTLQINDITLSPQS